MAGKLKTECRKLRELLPEYIDGTLEGGRRARLERHLAQCSFCSQELSDLQTVMQAARNLEPDKAPVELLTRIGEAIARQETTNVRLRKEPAALMNFWVRVAAPVAVGMGLLAMTFILRSAPKSPFGVISRDAAKSRLGPALGQEKTKAPTASESERAPTQIAQAPSDLQDRPMPSLSPNKSPALPPIKAYDERLQKEPNASVMQGPEKEELPTQEPIGEKIIASERAPQAGAVGGRGDAYTGQRIEGKGATGNADARTRFPGNAPPIGNVPPPYTSSRRIPPSTKAYQRIRATPETANESVIAKTSLAPLPVSARVRMIQEGKRPAILLDLTFDKSVGEVKAFTGERQSRKLLWHGLSGGRARVSYDLLGTGPDTIPITVESKAGSRKYKLFVPLISRLGQSAAHAPRGRYSGEQLETVLANFSALTGFVLLVEEPLDRKVIGDLPGGAPEIALDQIAAIAGFDLQREDSIVYTLSNRPE